MVKLLFTRRGMACWPRSRSLLLWPLLRWLFSVAAWRMHTARVARLAVGLQPGASTRISPGAPGSFEHGSVPVAMLACALERVFVRSQATACLLTVTRAHALTFWRLPPVHASHLCSVVNVNGDGSGSPSSHRAARCCAEHGERMAAACQQLNIAASTQALLSALEHRHQTSSRLPPSVSD